VDLMNRYPDMKIELSSHTDAQGRDDYNEKLSQRRADSAKTWMVTKGIAADRIVAVGSGEKFILNRCKNGVECPDEEHRFNRRTEFKIIAGPTSITIEEEVKD
ncbi:MAG: OmpA family protein, partial [Thermoanaerobaculia bacterium]|nr:OmpA family protein [Thermoanaerobaculia bacterium]